MMDKFSVRNRNGSEFSDASDIDLDDIAKMIDPLDDLEDNLFSNKAKQTSKKNSQAISLKKVMGSEAKSLTAKDTEEIEILTSMSSNNGQQGNMKFEDEIFGSLIKAQKIGRQAGITDENAERDEIEKHGTLKKQHVSDSKVSDLKTGLWSGDDLWNLQRNSEKQTAVHSLSISPVKSSKETGPLSFNSPTRSSKSFSITNQGFGQRRRSNNPEITASQNKKPGNFEWLGLLESSDEEKELSKKSKGQGISSLLANSSKEESHEIPRHKAARKNDLLGNNHFNNEENFKISKISADFSNRREFSCKQSTLKDSLSEDAQNVIPKMFMDSTVSKMQQEVSSLLHIGKGVPDATQTKLNGKKENETSSHHSLAKGNSSLMEDISGQLSKRSGRLKELERETTNEKSCMSKRGSISEENEASSTHAYAPKFIGDKLESSGRRRRRNENREAAGKTKETFSAIFDPLGLFLMDDKDKIEVNGSENKSLPEWLTGAKNKSEVEDQSLSPVENKQESSSSPEFKRDIIIDKKLDSSEVKGVSSNPLRGSGEPSEKVVSGEEAQLALSNDADRGKIDSINVADIIPGEKDLSLGSKESSKENHFTQEKSINKISGGDRIDSIKLSLADKKDRGRNTSKENAPHSENTSEDIGSDSEEHLKQKDLRRRKIIKESFLKKKGHFKGMEDYGSEGDHSLVSIRNSSFDSNSKKFAEREKYYLRKIRALEEKTIHLEYLEDELAQMNHLKGEVEHLRAIIHVLELEKSATESLVTSLQERHSDQIKRLEEVHKNEVKSLKEALSREEKRKAEEVERMAEDHRKTMDRLMETNVRMEEEFRNRMLEARKDWNRDAEAMRLTYQQSSNAAITNASLALLTGHGVGTSESKDKSEITKRNDSSSKLLSQCPEEVKGLSQTVERVETILMETLEAITPKVKKQNSKAVVNNVMGNQSKLGKIHKSVRDKRKAYFKVISPRKRRRFIQTEKERTHNRHLLSDEHLESDSSQLLGGGSSRDSVIEIHSLEGKKNNIRKFSNQFLCQYCKRCQHCRGKSSSPVNNRQRQKSNKEGENVGEKDLLTDNLQKDYGNGEKVFGKFHDSFWLKKIQDRKNLSPARAKMTLNENYFSTVLPHRQPGVIIDPKQYLMKLASGNRNNLFQPLDILNV